MTEDAAVLVEGLRHERTFGDAVREFAGCWLVVWLVSLLVLDEPFAPTVGWLLYSSLSVLVVPVLVLYTPLFLLSFIVRRVLGKSGWWHSHRLAIVTTVILSAISMYGMSLSAS